MDLYFSIWLSYIQRQDILKKLQKYKQPESFITLENSQA